MNIRAQSLRRPFPFAFAILSALIAQPARAQGTQPAELFTNGIGGVSYGAVRVDLFLEETVPPVVTQWAYRQPPRTDRRGWTRYGQAERGEPEVHLDTAGRARAILVPIARLRSGLHVLLGPAQRPGTSFVIAPNATYDELDRALPGCRRDQVSADLSMLHCRGVTVAQFPGVGPVLAFRSVNRASTELRGDVPRAEGDPRTRLAATVLPEQGLTFHVPNGDDLRLAIGDPMSSVNRNIAQLRRLTGFEGTALRAIGPEGTAVSLSIPYRILSSLTARETRVGPDASLDELERAADCNLGYCRNGFHVERSSSGPLLRFWQTRYAVGGADQRRSGRRTN